MVQTGETSREALNLDNPHSETISFGKGKGWFVSRNCLVIAFLCFICSLVATGLLVFFYSHPRQVVSGTLSDNVVHEYLKPEVRIVQQSPTSEAPFRQGSTTEKPRVKKDILLPTALKPVHYLVRLQPFINGNFSIHGLVEITVEVVEATDKIVLHMADIRTRNDTIKVREKREKPLGPDVKFLEHQYDPTKQFYIGSLKTALLPGRTYVISMEYEAYLNDDMAGFYRSHYKDPEGNKRWLAATQFQPVDARRAFPCFDEPALKATFAIEIIRENFMTALSNMPIKESIPASDQRGWTLDRFDTSVKMSTYLLAFIVFDFGYLQAQGTPLFRVWTKNESLPEAEYALEVGPKVTKAFERIFDIPYPLPKQDMVAVPDFSAGAMENWGLITYREVALLYKAETTSAAGKEYVAKIITHELAHQWFGNLVTPTWWTDLWLNEGFASYMENVGLAQVEPSFKNLEQFPVTVLQSVFGLDSLESSHPISVPVSHPDEIGEIFDSISYQKGASIIRMMSHFLNERTFAKGISNYLRHFAYGSADQDDLWEFLTKQAHADGTLPQATTVKDIMDTWTLQMGFPLITVKRKSDGTYTLNQERFLLLKSPNSTDTHNYRWWVPITYSSESKVDFSRTEAMQWMAPDSQMGVITGVPASDRWIVVNNLQTGYYRVNYDNSNWKALAVQLQKDPSVISNINRAQILDDAFSLARAGVIPYGTALDLLSYLENETDFIPWIAALNNLSYLKNMLSNSGGYGAFQAFVLKLLNKIYTETGFHDNLDSPHLDQRKRGLILSWACHMGNSDCIQNSISLFNNWRMNPTNYSIISPNVKSVVYCTAVAEGGLDEWNFAWDAFVTTGFSYEKRHLLGAMGCSRKPWILSGYLKMAFQKESAIRKQDFTSVISAIAGNENGKSIAWEFLKDQWKQLYNYYGKSAFSLQYIVKSIIGSLNQDIHYKELSEFKERNSATLGTARRAVDQALERTKNNVAWMKANQDTVLKWLRKNGYSNKFIEKL